MLVSTHNLGSVPEFCDRTVLVKGTVLAYGPTETTFTRDNLERAFGGVLRHFMLGGTDLHDDDDSREITHPHRRRTPLRHLRRQDPHPARRRNDRDAAGAVSIRLHDQRHVGFGPGRRGLRVSVGLPDAERLVADRRRAVAIPSCRGWPGPICWACPSRWGPSCPGGLAAAAMLFLNQRTGLKEDTIIGLIFTSFFGLGLFMISISPMSIDVQTITMGNILAISPGDTLQLVIIGFVSLAVLLVMWKDLMVTFFDETHARIHRPAPRPAEGGLLHPALGLLRGGDADGGGVSGHRHGRHPRRHRLSVDRPLSPPADACGRHRRRSPALSGPISAISSTARPAASSCSCRPLIFLAGLRLRAEARLSGRPPPRAASGQGHDRRAAPALPVSLHAERLLDRR